MDEELFSGLVLEKVGLELSPSLVESLRSDDMPPLII
jgi:hypothetical protein